jgi:hypothetical protein
MKGNFIKSTGRATVLAAFLLGLFLPAGARAQGNGHAPVQAPEHEGDHPVWLMIMAFTDAPVVGADVRVSVQGRLLADAKAATNNQGVFPAPLRSPWILGEEAAAAANAPEPDQRRRRSLVRISVSGGTTNGDPFPGTLTADVVLTDPAHQIVVVNPVTTLVSRVLNERPDLELVGASGPELKLDGAEALVRRFLKLPPNYSLGLALRQSSGYASPFFSPVAFMTEARDAGGLGAFEHLLLQELGSPQATRSFPNTKALGDESSLATDLAKAALKGAGGQFAGWVMKQTGLVTPDLTKDDIKDLQQQLTDLQSSLDDLSSQVAQLTALVKSTATLNLYNTITEKAQDYATKITAHESALDTYAQWCPPLAEGSTPPTTGDPYCIAQKPDVLSDLHTEYLNAYYEEVEGYIQDNGKLGTEGMLHLYSLWLGQSKQFFRPADSTKMQSLYDYWDGVLTSAANLRMEYFHYLNFQDPNSPGGNATITQFIGNPDLDPPSSGLFQHDRAANLKLMFPAVPAGTVINTTDRNHLMWALVPWVPSGGSGPFGPSAYVPAPQCWSWASPFFQVASYYPLEPYAGFKNWVQSPNKDQWQALVQNAPTNTNWRTWLIDQTKTTGDELPASPGFFDWTRCSGMAHPYAWTSTPDGQASPGTSQKYWYINPIDDNYGSLSFSQLSNYNIVNGTGGLAAFPARTLATGEQYFWYQ